MAATETLQSTKYMTCGDLDSVHLCIHMTLLIVEFLVEGSFLAIKK